MEDTPRKLAVPPEIVPSSEEEHISEPQVRFVRLSDISLFHSIEVLGDTRHTFITS